MTLKQFIQGMMSQGMSQEVGCLNSLVSYVFSVFAPLKEKFFEKTPKRCYLLILPIIQIKKIIIVWKCFLD